MAIKALDRKLLRDLLRMRGQVIAIVLIVTCGMANLVTMMSTHGSLQLTQAIYYDQYRFADVFVQLKRAPKSLISRFEEIPDASGAGRYPVRGRAGRTSYRSADFYSRTTHTHAQRPVYSGRALPRAGG